MLSPIQKRFTLFLGGCIPVRLLAAWVAYYLSRNNTNGLRLLAGLAVLPVICWAIILIFGLRKTGAETQDAPIWWNFMRPIHMLLYTIFIYLALSKDINKQKQAWIVLVCDAVIGLIAFLWHHSQQGSFRKL